MITRPMFTFIIMHKIGKLRVGTI